MGRGVAPATIWLGACMNSCSYGYSVEDRPLEDRGSSAPILTQYNLLPHFS